MRQVYLNGQYLPETEAKISIFDRGFVFADAVYEVTAVLDGKLIDFAGHLARLRRSLGELDMPFSMDDADLLAIHRRLVELNQIDEGLVYIQVSRGVADRDFIFPDRATPNTVVLYTQKKHFSTRSAAELAQRVIILEDQRWQRCDIKTVQLLYSSMAKNQAKKAGADDAWLVRDGLVTEGSSSNAYIVTAEGAIVTRDVSNLILNGITRRAVLECARELGLTLEERGFDVAEAKAAKEAFITSATTLVSPVVQIDGVAIGDGKPGPVAARLREIYLAHSRAEAI
ncbi:D-amino-acid transaminase [Cognatazoarcus halotolerans]|uniref:D-amino-acid transaminase n=1 Tax=Cognatazoarcus halotolerans TaxID=2686016 RepID=UPI001356FB7F|nr:D-amino-acid transaminase [Cognatazoarcus halotolerans]MCB1899304.1 D-amino-acid transaminase [Rhodocyclaceae bacterium]MCP5310260.1 D-amino-acid transaminase [Zoogloeaceae bacterium]